MRNHFVQELRYHFVKITIFSAAVAAEKSESSNTHYKHLRLREFLSVFVHFLKRNHLNLNSLILMRQNHSVYAMPLTKEITKTKVEIEPELLTETQEEDQVIVHCSFYNDPSVYIGDVGVRVWKETYIIDEQSKAMNQMIKAFGIVYQPQWHFIKPGDTKKFTMVFNALPKSCVSFTLAEIIPQAGAFVVKGIRRNHTDIYSVKLE